MTDYLTAEEIKSSLALTGSTDLDEQFARAVTTASRVVERMTGRFFTPGAPGTVRYFSTSGFTSVAIDDATAVTEVAIDPSDSGTWVALTAATDYYLEPRNATQFGFPYTEVRSRPSVGWVSRWDTPFGWASRFDNIYPNTVRVTGTFGWPAVPDEIKTATEIITTKLMRRMRDAPLGFVVSDVAGAVRLTRYDPDLAMLLNPFDRTPLFI